MKEHVQSIERGFDAFEELRAAVFADDAAQVAHALDRNPALKRRLNDSLPGHPFGDFLLLVAVQRGRRDVIDALLAAGADINARTHWWAGSFGVLDTAARPDKPAWLVPYLIERGATVDAHAAAALGMLDRLKELVAASPAVVHTRGGDGQTPLHFASTVKIARYLLEHGAEIDALDVDHESTPAQYMVRDRQDVARYLVGCGCRTDVLMAAALGDLELVRKHLDADPACIRVSVSEAYFPKRDPRAGGSIYIWTLGNHKTAHLVAREFGQEEVFRLLMERSPAELKLVLACDLGDEAAFKSLLAANPGLVQRLSEEDRRKLAYAAQSNNNEAVRLMLAAGWPVDSRGQHQATVLHWAAFHGNAAMVKEILRYQPPLEARDSDYKGTPLGWAVYGSVHGWHRQSGDYAGATEALLEAGAEAPKLTADLEATDSVRAVLRRYVENG
jgi:ankyrin repeat protein